MKSSTVANANGSRPSRTHTHARAQGALNGQPVITRHELPDTTELALSDKFVERHRSEVRYVAEWGRWLQFRGGRWQIEKTYRAFDLAKRICRAAAADNARAAGGIATARTAAAIVTLARADREIAATADEWDADPWLLNTPCGTVDLHNGSVRPHDPDDRITKIAGTGPDPRCSTPVWTAFLNRIFEDNADLLAYTQRLAGYSLTGDTREQALFFGYGTGANGKSVLLTTLAGILGEYHRAAPIETFTASTFDRHPTELARLRGARLVTATETEEGRRWAESRIKALTGGDTISARFMRGDYFEYVPEFKLIIAGNHKPGLRSVDEAMRRRFNLLPFAVTIPPAERDHDLPAKLKAEWPGIMSWAIDGCLSWQREGLCPPAAVKDATALYLEAEDALGAWMGECCFIGPRHQEASAALFQSWRTWAERAGEPPGSQKRFTMALEARGFGRLRTMAARLIEGLALRSHDA